MSIETLKKEINLLRIIPYRLYSASFNMAADDFFLNHSTIPVLRFYGWKSPTLSFGKSQLKLNEIDIPFCEAQKFDFVKRITGGKTVFHHQELTYSIVVQTNLLPRKIMESYRIISEILSTGIQSFGIKPTMSAAVNSDESGICFKEISSYELAIKGKKLIGSAQHRNRNNILQHGSILLKINWDLWKQIWGLPVKSKILERRMTSFFDETGKDVDPNKLGASITDAFQRVLDTKIQFLDITEEERSSIYKIEKKYKWKLRKA